MNKTYIGLSALTLIRFFLVRKNFQANVFAFTADFLLRDRDPEGNFRGTSHRAARMFQMFSSWTPNNKEMTGFEFMIKLLYMICLSFVKELNVSRTGTCGFVLFQSALWDSGLIGLANLLANGNTSWGSAVQPTESHWLPTSVFKTSLNIFKV